MSEHGKHPKRQTLEEFLSGRIADDDIQSDIEAHIDACDECARRLSEISVDQSLLGVDARSTSEIRVDRAPSMDLPAEDTQTLVRQSPQSLVGNWLGKYKIVGAVGHGGMGTVYQAEDTILNRTVAIKVLMDTAAGEKGVMTQLIDEARTAGAIAHPNVVTIYDFVTASDVDFLAMEFLAGGSVADMIAKSSALDWQEAVRVMSEACQGVDAAHRRGILHRDIKPANLLLTRDRQVKVGDFGLAMDGSRQAMKPSGGIAGTVHFMSPEQCRGEPLDQRSDIYAIGATFFTLLTGQPPYREFGSARQITYAHCHAPVPDPQQIESTIPKTCAAIVMRAMSKSREHRYASCGELIDQFASLSTIRSSDSSGRRWRQYAKLPTGPTVVVLPLECLSTDPEDVLIAQGIACELNGQLSQFHNLRVVAQRTASRYATRELSDEELRRELSADYVVGGTLQRIGTRLRLTATLSCVETSATMWSQRYDRTLSAENLFEIQDEIAESVSNELAQPYGEVHRAERSKYGDEGDQLSLYSCILRFYDYWHRESLEDYWPVRNSLADVVERFPEFAPARAALSLMLVNALRVHHLPDHDDALQRAAEHAGQALQLEPWLEMAHQALVSAQYHLGNMQEFLLAAEKALRTYPNHCELLADIGFFFVLSGDLNRGLPLVKKAIALSPDPPGWYFSALVINDFLNGDFQSALQHSGRMGGDNVWGQLHSAVALAFLGRTNDAASHLTLAKSFVPELDTELDVLLSFFRPSDQLRKIYFEGLVRAGLKVQLPNGVEPQSAPCG